MNRPMQAHERFMANTVRSHEESIRVLMTVEAGGIEEEALMESLGIDTDGDLAESATEALDAYALEVRVVRRVEVVLGIGGPTTYLSADVERDTHGCFVRETPVTLHDSWSVPQETRLPITSPLVDLFDRFIDGMLDD